MKRLITEWEKIFASDKMDNTQHSQKAHITQYQKTNNLIKKWAEKLNGHFSKEEMCVAKRHVKRCLMPLVIREMQINTTVILPLTHQNIYH